MSLPHNLSDFLAGLKYLSTSPPSESACDICLIPYAEYDQPVQIRSVTGCNHVFGHYCLTRWLSEHNTCPMCRKELFDVPGLIVHPEAAIDTDDAAGNENRPASVSSNSSVPESNPTAEDLIESLLEVERETIEIEESLRRTTELLRQRELLLRQRELLQTARAEREVALRQLRQALEQSTEHSEETRLVQHTLSGETSREEITEGDDACSSAASSVLFDEERTREGQTEQEVSPEDVLEQVRNLGNRLEGMRRRFEDICAGLDRLAI